MAKPKNVTKRKQSNTEKGIVETPTCTGNQRVIIGTQSLQSIFTKSATLLLPLSFWQFQSFPLIHAVSSSIYQPSL